MFKGIQELRLVLLLVIFSFSGLASEKIVNDSVRELVSICQKVCSKDPKKILLAGYPKNYSKQEGNKEHFYEETCYDLECKCATEGVSTGSVSDDSAISLAEGINEGGYAGGRANNKCKVVLVKTTTVEVVNDVISDETVVIEERKPVEESTSIEVVGGGSISISVGGTNYACNAGESPKECAIRHGLMKIGDDYKFTIITQGDGSIVYGLEGTSAGSSTGDIVISERRGGDLEVKCMKKERVWYYLWLAKDWVESNDCHGSSIATRSGSERLVGRVIDEDFDSGSSSRGRGDDYATERRYYVEFRGRSVSCNYGESTERCITDRYGSAAYDEWLRLNCVDCQNRIRRSRDNGGDSLGKQIAMVAGAILPPLAMYGSAKVAADARVDVAAQCRMMQTNAISSHYKYITDNELPSNTDPYVPECNGYGASSYPGGWMNSGVGTWGSPWGSLGYSNNYMGLMAGPYAGTYNTWNTSGLMMNPSLGLNLNLDPTSALLSSMLGLNGSVGLNYGVNTPWNYNVNPNAWGNANFAFNPQWNAYSNGLVPWGNNANAWANNGWNGNWNTNGQWGVNGGWNNGGWNNGGQYNNGSWNNNGSVNGSDWWSVNNSFAANNQAYQAGKNYQQMALQNQVNRSVGNLSGYSPAYSPMNMNSNFNLNWQFI